MASLKTRVEIEGSEG